MSDLFRKAMTEISHRIGLRSTEAELLKLFRTSSGTYSAFAELIEDDPELEGNILQVANKAVEGKLKEAIVSPAAALSFLGFLPTRNFIAASVVKAHSPSLAPGNSEVNEAVKLALASEALGKEGDPTRGDFFVGGLVFDALRALAREGGLAVSPEIAEKRLTDLWNHGKVVAQTAQQLARTLVPEMAVDKDIVMDGMLHDIGRAMFALLASEKEAPPEGPELERDLSTEAGRWEFSHPVYGNLLLNRFLIFKETAWVALFHHQPFLAARLGPLVYARTMLIWLADRMVAFKDLNGSAKFSTEHIRRWNLAAAPALKIQEETFSAALGKVSL